MGERASERVEVVCSGLGEGSRRHFCGAAEGLGLEMSAVDTRWIIISSCRPAWIGATRPSGAVPNTSKKNVGWNGVILLCGGCLGEHSKHGELRCNLPTHWPGWSWAPFPAARLDPSVSHLYFELGTAKKRSKLDREREPKSDKAPVKRARVTCYDEAVP